MAQLDSASDSDSEGRRFESFRVGQKRKHSLRVFFVFAYHKVQPCAKATLSAEGSHSPLEDRQARLLGAERANPRRWRVPFRVGQKSTSFITKLVDFYFFTITSSLFTLLSRNLSIPKYLFYRLFTKFDLA